MHMSLLVGLIALVGMTYGQEPADTLACFDKYGMKSCSDCWNPPLLCYGCSSGYVTARDHQSCVACASNCYECRLNADDTTTTCQECLFGYTFGFGSASKDCVACGDFCGECAYDSAGTQTCDECFEGNYIKSKVNAANCLSCGSNCEACSADAADSITCTQCSDRYYVKDGSCSTCPSNCLTCSENSDGDKICSACASNYKLSDDAKSCLPCQSGCAACSAGAATGSASFAKCTTCKDGYYLQDDVCQTCFSNCDKCSSGTVCDTCDSGYYPNAATATSCDPCSWKCKTCTSSTDCSECDAEYAVKLDTDVTCDPCPSNCASCTISGAVSGTCSSCSSGYYKTSSNKCSKCPANCASCAANTGTCNSCNSGFIKADDNNCYAEVTNCNAGNTYNTTENKAYCTGCKTDFAISEDKTQCIGCVTGCTGICAHNATVGATECQCNGGTLGADTSERGDCSASVYVCKEGYYLDTAGVSTSGLQNCVSCPTDGCKECNATSTACMTCKTGYASAPDTNGDCHKCATGCSACTYDSSTSTETCSSCSTGYYKDGTTCKKCGALCATCSSSTSCSTYACVSPCTSCSLNSAGDGLDCSNCPTGYALNDADKTCTACPANCADCEYDTTNALICKTDSTCDTYYGRKSDKLCYRCPRDCTSCTVASATDDTLVCDNCASGFIENNKYCTPCSSNCVKCEQSVGNVTGTAARARYYLDTDKTCKACPSSCAKCSASSCQECDAGYGLSVDKKSCVACNTLTKVDNCALCMDAMSDGNATCTACSSGFVLSDEANACTATSILGAACDEPEDHEPECKTCTEASGRKLAYDDDDDDFEYPKLCSNTCLKCGSVTINDDYELSSLDIMGDVTLCNDKKEEGNYTETVDCLEGACVAVAKFENKEMTAAARGCLPNITFIEPDNGKAPKGNCVTISDTVTICVRPCFGDSCNLEYFSGSGTICASLMVVMAALLHAFSLI